MNTAATATIVPVPKPGVRLAAESGTQAHQISTQIINTALDGNIRMSWYSYLYHNRAYISAGRGGHLKWRKGQGRNLKAANTLLVLLYFFQLSVSKRRYAWSSIFELSALASDLGKQSCCCLSFVVLTKPQTPSAPACSPTRTPANPVLVYCGTVSYCTARHAIALLY